MGECTAGALSGVQREDTQLDLAALLSRVEATSPVEVIDAIGEELAQAIKANHVALLIANFSGSALMRVSHVPGTGRGTDGRNERAEPVPLPGTAYERVLFTQTREVVRDGAGWLALVPITERGDAIGVLEVSLASEPDVTTLDDLVGAAHALAYALIASRRHTDLFEWAQRDIPFSIAAEIQRRLLPSAYTAEAGPLTVAGWLEPANDVGGDTFDYCLDRDYLYASITDAMGHGVEAALLATLTVGALRNCRRGVASPAEQADAANQVMRNEARDDQFVTGLILRIRLADGRADVVVAGHPMPFLLRDGDVVPLDLTTQLPLGFAMNPYRSDTVLLKPGDRLLLVTDGYLDRLAARLDIGGVLMRTLHRHPRQIVQELAHGVLTATNGRPPDDATVLCLDWYGPAHRRDATGGASQGRATKMQNEARPADN